jgi:hypothetical protein
MVAAVAHAQQFPHMPSPTEVAALPDFCQAKMGTNAAFSDAWRQRMGPDKYVHLHHYCHGLIAMNRLVVATNKQTRRDLQQRATQEFDYVIRNWPPDFVLAIDARNKKSMAQSMLSMQ